MRTSPDARTAGASSGVAEFDWQHRQHERSSRGLLLQPHRTRARSDIFVARQQSHAVSDGLAVHGGRCCIASPGSSFADECHYLAPHGRRSGVHSTGTVFRQAGIEFEPLYVDGTREAPLKFQAPALVLNDQVTTDRLTRRGTLLKDIDAARRQLDGYSNVQKWSEQQHRAMSLLMSSGTTEAFDVASEPESIRQRYGESINGTSLLLARRLVEAGVPFITVFWKGDEKAADLRKCASGGGWDTHGNNFGCLKDDLLPQFDRGFSALVEDLAQRGLLDQTLLLVTSEMGRKPKIGDPRSGGVNGAGRDHWTHCLTDVMAGGGIRGGQTYGTSDRFGEYPSDKPLTPADVTKTVYHAMGVTDLQAFDAENRPYNLLAEGNAITELF